MGTALILLLLLLEAGFIGRVLLRPHRDPASRIAWIVVILAAPLVGFLTYLLLGETNVGHRRVERMKKVMGAMPGLASAPGFDADEIRPQIPDHRWPLFKVGRSINGFEALGGNSARLTADSNATIDEMVADIDAAEEHVHLLFYIWLPDKNGRKMVEALKRAASRGVTCRAMVDDLGSRTLIRSEHWGEMKRSGITLARALPIGNPLLRALLGRIDLRNHRKFLTIDNKITYCGTAQEQAGMLRAPRSTSARSTTADVRTMIAVSAQSAKT